MSQLADSFITDLSMTLKFYEQRRNGSADLNELVSLSEHLLDALGAIRANQVLRNVDKGQDAMLELGRQGNA